MGLGDLLNFQWDSNVLCGACRRFFRNGCDKAHHKSIQEMSTTAAGSNWCYTVLLLSTEVLE